MEPTTNQGANMRHATTYPKTKNPDLARRAHAGMTTARIHLGKALGDAETRAYWEGRCTAFEDLAYSARHFEAAEPIWNQVTSLTHGAEEALQDADEAGDYEGSSFAEGRWEAFCEAEQLVRGERTNGDR